MTTAREDFFWMIEKLRDASVELSEDEGATLNRIEDRGYVEPVDEVHIVRVPFSERPALAVRTNVEEAVAIAQIYNADRDGHLAEVTTYRTHGLAKGINVEVPNA